MPFKPQFDGDFPTLGYQVVDWIENYLTKPDVADYVPFRLYQEQVDFIAEFYRLDPATGRRLYHRSVLSRPRGWGKSPLAAALCAAEGMGPVRFDGWDAEGQPVGAPWALERTPLVVIAAVSEDQVHTNTYSALLEMLDNADLYDDYPGLEPMGGQVNLPKGQIKPISASGASIKGARAVFGVMDQTEVWYRGNGGHKLAETMRSNAAKIGGTTLETPNAFVPGEESVAEESSKFAELIETGEAIGSGVLWDHREAPADTDMSDAVSLTEGMRIAYGDSAGDPRGCAIHEPPCDPGHVDLARLVTEVQDLNKDPQVSRSDFLNQITHASDAWMARYEWLACEDREKKVEPGDTIVLGFDGSRGRARGNADATALVAMRVKDRHLFPIRVWEARQGETDWQAPAEEVDRVVRDVFDYYNVVGFYADPSGWQTHVAEWDAAFGRKLRIRATQNSPIGLWPRGKNSGVAHLTEQFHQAVLDQEISHDGSAVVMRHVLNARRRRSKGGGYLLYKEFPESPAKVDAAYAAIMAFKACVDAQSRGLGKTRKQGPRFVAMR